MLIFKDKRKNFGKLTPMVTTEVSPLIVAITKKRQVQLGNLMGTILTNKINREVRYYEPSASPVRQINIQSAKDRKMKQQEDLKKV